MKQVIVLRTDLAMSTGKLVAQACHTSVMAALSAPAEALDLWEREGQPKIVLKATSLSDLIELKNKCGASPLIHHSTKA